LVADADDDDRDLPGSISFASRLCDAGRRRPRLGDPGLDDGDEWGEDGEPVVIVGTASAMTPCVVCYPPKLNAVHKAGSIGATESLGRSAELLKACKQEMTS
jgi:hypothetical protein